MLKCTTVGSKGMVSHISTDALPSVAFGWGFWWQLQPRVITPALAGPGYLLPPELQG